MSDLITTTKREKHMTQARTTLVATVTFSTERAGWTIDFVDGVSSTTNGSWTVQKYLERFAYFNTRFLPTDNLNIIDIYSAAVLPPCADCAAINGEFCSENCGSHFYDVV